jgi:hypothetical protein
MFDNLRDSGSSPFFQDDEEQQPEEQPRKPAARNAMAGGFSFVDRRGRILGMTAVQRFVISLMLLMVVCVLGSMLLLVTGAFYVPLF